MPRLLSIVETERARRRADAEDAPAILLDAIARVLDTGQIRDAASAAARGVSRQQSAQIRRQVAAAAGVDVTLGDASIPALIQHFASEYTSLIVDVGDEVRRRAAAAVAAGVSGSQTAAQIARQLRDIAGLAPKRARRIARDQLGKLHGALNEARQRELGVTEYRWRTSRDQRVRGNPSGKFRRARYSHWAREGQTFRWDRPPPDGHPGEAVLCRCHAEPVLDHLLDLDRPVAPDTASPQRAPEFVVSAIGLEPIAGYRHRTIEVSSAPDPALTVGLDPIRGEPAVTPDPAPQRLYISPEAEARARQLARTRRFVPRRFR